MCNLIPIKINWSISTVRSNLNIFFVEEIMYDFCPKSVGYQDIYAHK